MKSVLLSAAIAAICCLGSSLSAQTISNASPSNLEERRLELQRQLDDYRFEVDAEQRNHETAVSHLADAQAAIDRAMADGRFGTVELMWWDQANRSRANSQLQISRIQSRIRDTEAELRRLELAARQTRKPVSPVAETAIFEDSTAKPNDPIEQEFAKLQGTWPGMYHGLKIEGRKVRIYGRTEENIYVIDARIELDPVKGHMDFHFDNGKVCRHLYNWRVTQDGKPSFALQKNLFNPEQRPTRVKMLWEADPQEIDVFQRNPN